MKLAGAAFRSKLRSEGRVIHEEVFLYIAAETKCSRAEGERPCVLRCARKRGTTVGQPFNVYLLNRLRLNNAGLEILAEPL